MRQNNDWKMKVSVRRVEDETKNKCIILIWVSTFANFILFIYLFTYLVLLIFMVVWFYLAKFRKLPRYEERDLGLSYCCNFARQLKWNTGVQGYWKCFCNYLRRVGWVNTEVRSEPFYVLSKKGRTKLFKLKRN